MNWIASWRIRLSMHVRLYMVLLSLFENFSNAVTQVSITFCLLANFKDYPPSKNWMNKHWNKININVFSATFLLKLKRQPAFGTPCICCFIRLIYFHLNYFLIIIHLLIYNALQVFIYSDEWNIILNALIV